jgi:hypothetical protein
VRTVSRSFPPRSSATSMSGIIRSCVYRSTARRVSTSLSSCFASSRMSPFGSGGPATFTTASREPRHDIFCVIVRAPTTLGPERNEASSTAVLGAHARPQHPQIVAALDRKKGPRSAAGAGCLEAIAQFRGKHTTSPSTHPDGRSLPPRWEEPEPPCAVPPSCNRPVTRRVAGAPTRHRRVGCDRETCERSRLPLQLYVPNRSP